MCLEFELVLEYCINIPSILENVDGRRTGITKIKLHAYRMGKGLLDTRSVRQRGSPTILHDTSLLCLQRKTAVKSSMPLHPSPLKTDIKRKTNALVVDWDKAIGVLAELITPALTLYRKQIIHTFVLLKIHHDSIKRSQASAEHCSKPRLFMWVAEWWCHDLDACF